MMRLKLWWIRMRLIFLAGEIETRCEEVCYLQHQLLAALEAQRVLRVQETLLAALLDVDAEISVQQTARGRYEQQ